MSTAGSASNSPSAGRRNRPEVQLYIPGKTRLSKEKQQSERRDYPDQDKIVLLIEEKQKQKNGQNNTKNGKNPSQRSSANSEKENKRNNRIVTESETTEKNNNSQKSRRKQGDKRDNGDSTESKRVSGESKREVTETKNNQKKNKEPTARPDTARNQRGRGRGGRGRAAANIATGPKRQAHVDTDAQSDSSRNSKPNKKNTNDSKLNNYRSNAKLNESNESRKHAEPKLSKNNQQPKPESNNNQSTTEKKKDRDVKRSEETDNRRNTVNESNRKNGSKSRNNSSRQNRNRRDNSPKQNKDNKSSRELNQKSPQKSVCDWGDMMNEEDDWADSGGDTKQQLPRRDSWASEMIKEDDSKHQTIIVPSSRPRRIEEERSQPIQASTATSVIRLNPCDMPRVRKESEKYNASDNESYGQSREPVIYGGNPRGGNSRGRGRGRGRGGRGAHHNYDPDYDRNVPYRPKSEVTPRSREDRFSRNSERSDGGDHGPSRQMTKNEHLMRDLKQKIKELGWSYEKVNGSTGVEFSPIKKRVLDLYREIVLNDPELTFQEKVDNNFWSGVFYKEVELFRRLQANSTEGDAATLRSKYIDTLYSAIDYYQNLILSLENFYHFNLKFYASEGARHAKTRQLKMCLYLCQQFNIHMGDLTRYIENADKKGASDPVKQRKTKSAREYYTAAKDLDPRHAKPHFQLGVLSSEQQRHFEAIIHYIRAASVDKAGGQSTTMSLNKEFEMARREAVSFLAREDQQREIRRRFDNSDIWVINLKDKTIPRDVLNKRFKLSYLAALGRIYTGIDIDQLEQFSTQSLNDFDTLLRMTRDDGRSYMPPSSLVDIAISSLFAVQCASDTNSNLTGALKLFFGLIAIMLRRLASNLKATLGSRPKGNAYIIGDSMIRLLPLEKTSNCQVDLHPQPGKTINGVRKYIDVSIQKDPTVPVCIIHVGTNDASTRDRKRKIDDIVVDFRELFQLCSEKFPNAVISYSDILPRWDNDNDRVVQINREMKEVAKQLNIRYIDSWSQFDNARKFYKYNPNTNSSDSYTDAVHLNDLGKKALAQIFSDFIDKELARMNPITRALESHTVTSLLPAMRIMMEFFGTKELRTIWFPPPESLEPVSDPCGPLADVANILMDSNNQLPVPVTRRPSTKYHSDEIKITCLESDDLQGFKPLSKSQIGAIWYANQASSGASRNLCEDCVRLSVIKDAIDLQMSDDNKLITKSSSGKYVPLTELDPQKSSKPVRDEHLMTIKYVVPDTNCWIERRGDLIRIMETDRYQLEVILALHVRHELEGLTNNERVRNEAKTALDMIRKNNIRCLTSKGALLQGGKNYGEVKEERTRNDDIIKNSVKCLAGAVLLTDDRNLIVKSRSEKVPVDSMKSFRQWLEKA